MEQIDNDTFNLLKLHEKPQDRYPNLNIAVVSGYILDNDIFDSLTKISKSLKPGEELKLTDAINDMLLQKKKIVIRLVTGGEYFDIGNKTDYVKSIIAASLKRPDMKDIISSYITKQLNIPNNQLP